MKDYIVTIHSAQYNDEDQEFYAKNAADAIKQARKFMANSGWNSKYDGKLTYKAKAAELKRWQN